MDTIEIYKGMKIEIAQDDYNESPSEWGNDDVCFWHREIEVKHPEMTKDIFGAYTKHEGYAEYKDEAKEIAKKYWIFPLDAYIHSGIALSMHGEGYNCRFDTSDFVGCILIKKSEARLHGKAEKIAKGILLTWNDYLSGNIYRFSITDPLTGDFVSGCGGFYGDYETSGLLDNAKDDIDNYIGEERKKAVAVKIDSLKAEIATLEQAL